MWAKLLELGDRMMRLVGHLDREQWLIVFVVVVIIGFFCMRGFGSRYEY